MVEHPRRFFSVGANYRLTPEYEGPYANGDWPFRGRPPAPRGAGLRTVVVLGDSCVFGIGLAPADTLPHRLQVELAKRAVTPTGVEVLNFGVPGYSTVQVRALLEETLSELQPDIVVAYPAAWNDQNAAIGVNDIELRDRGASSTFARRIRESALGKALSGLFSQNTSENPEVIEDWQQRRAAYGDRVPEPELEGELVGLVSMCAQSGADLILIAPAHPAETAREHPRTRRDAATVREVAKRCGIPCLDAQELFLQTGFGDEVLFSDFVHPTAFGIEALQAALAEEVEALMGPSRVPLGNGHLAITSVEPKVISAMGGEQLRIRLSGTVTNPIAVTVGGALLLDARLESPREIVGTLGANNPGVHEVVVQAGTGVAWLADAVTLAAPRLEPLDEDARTLRVTSRAGDRVLLFIAARKVSPRQTPQGLDYLDRATLIPGMIESTCGADGVGLVSLGADLSGRGWAQALVLPRGLPETFSFNALLSNPLEVTAD